MRIGAILSTAIAQNILGASSRPDRKATGITSEWGTVGWVNDNNPVDYGPAWDDGMTLVKVTLYRGRRPGFETKLQPGIASGMQVLAHLDSRLFKAPTNGTRVIVIFPGGDTQTPANGAIVFVADKSPTSGFDASTMMLPVPDGSTLNVGDATAAFVAHSGETNNSFTQLTTLWGSALGSVFLSALQTYLGAIQPIADPTSTATNTMVDAINAFVTAIGEAVTEINEFAQTLPTKKLKGT
jgi:hypothetical protein